MLSSSTSWPNFDLNKAFTSERLSSSCSAEGATPRVTVHVMPSSSLSVSESSTSCPNFALNKAFTSERRLSSCSAERCKLLSSSFLHSLSTCSSSSLLPSFSSSSSSSFSVMLSSSSEMGASSSNEVILTNVVNASGNMDAGDDATELAGEGAAVLALHIGDMCTQPFRNSFDCGPVESPALPQAPFNTSATATGSTGFAIFTKRALC